MLQDLISSRFQSYSSKQNGILLRYVNDVKYRYDIVLPKICGYQHCGEKTGFYVRSMLDQYYFCITSTTQHIASFFAWTFYHFPCLHILEGDMVRIKKYYCDKYYSIVEWGKSGGICSAKIK